MPWQIYKGIRGFRRERENIREKEVKSSDFQEPRKITSNLSVFLAPILSWLV